MYADSVNKELEDKYLKSLVRSGPPRVVVDLAARIDSTADGGKVHNSQTGAMFEIDFEHMRQTNVNSGYSRQVLREEEAGELPKITDLLNRASMKNIKTAANVNTASQKLSRARRRRRRSENALAANESLTTACRPKQAGLPSATLATRHPVSCKSCRNRWGTTRRPLSCHPPGGVI